jgi:L-lysine exporter family protein LysE/ArgO
MVEALALGVGTGIFLSLGFGSVFFALIQNSIDNGYKAGVQIALGVVIGDFLLVALAILGTSFLPSLPYFKETVSVVGAVLLVGLGVSQFLQTSVPQRVVERKLFHFFYFFVKGFFLNVLNPVNFFSWIFLTATLKRYNYSTSEEIVFFLSSITMIFVCESAMAFFAHKIKERLSSKTMLYIKYLSGIVFIFVACKLLYDTFWVSHG